MDYTFNPFSNKLDAINSPAELSKQSGAVCGFSGVRLPNSETIFKLATIRMEVPSSSYAIDEDYGEFSCLLTVMQHQSKAYSLGNEAIFAGQFFLKILFRHSSSMNASIMMLTNSNITLDSINIIARDEEGNSLVRIFDIYINIANDYSRYFYSMDLGLAHMKGVSIIDAETEQGVSVLPSSLAELTVTKSISGEQRFAVTNQTTVTCVHNMGKYPSVTILDDTNKLVLADVTYTSELQLQVTFSQQFTGSVILN